MRSFRTSLSTFLLVALFLATAAARQAGSDPDPAGLGDRGLAARHQAMLDLANPFTVMCVACHPDDEDGATLTLERRRYGARTVTLFATSGEGGQNAVGPELYDELGRIRERETVEASAIQGSEPYFLRLSDFGFSKSGDEAMRVWEEQMGGHDRLVEQFVAAIRALRPDAIITNHDTKSGHGQHQATGRLLVEAFEAAGDAARFPAAGPAWRPQALYLRARPDAAEGVSLETGLYDPVRGLTYREQAFRALLRHATQGPWQLEPYPRATRYVRVAGRPGSAAGVGSPLTASLALPAGEFRLADAAAEPAAALDAKLRAALADPAVDERYRPEIARALLAAHGAEVAFALEPEAPVAGEPVRARVVVANGGRAPVALRQVHVTSTNVAAVEWGPPEAPREVPAGRTALFEETMRTDGVSEPGELFGPVAPGFTRLSGGARGPAGSGLERVTALVELAAGGAPVSVEEVEYLRPLPPVRVAVAPAPGGRGHRAVVTNLSSRPLDLRLSSGGGPPGGAPRRVEPGREAVFSLEPESAETVSVVGAVAGGEGGEPVLATARVVRLPASVAVAPGLSVGYVRSYEFTLPEALERLGVAHRELTPEAVRDTDLSTFDTIVVDNRAYLKYPELARHNARLLEFVANGGTLVVFYHKTEEYDPAALAPYPFKIGRGRVTDENAPVEILEPAHPVFTTPNRITADDFRGWVQERGLYFPSEWDARYTPLLASHDPGEEPLRGGLLVARHGKGTFVYTSYVWYRQLRGNVAGGYRLFANLISLGTGSRR